MKDIENSMPQSAAALARLARALDRLESAAAKGGRVPDSTTLQAELGRLRGAHEALRATAGRVAGRLDATIARLSASLEDGT